MVEIRRASEADAQLLAKAGRETFLKAFEGQINEQDLIAFADKRYGIQQQTEELAQAGTVFLIAHFDGKVAGTAKLCQSEQPECIKAENVIELERLYLYPVWYGTGVAHALMDRCLELARETGCESMWLDVWDQNLRAEAFYRKYGFNTVGDRAYVVGSFTQRHLLMYRSRL